jgi:hypothetical protein
MRHLSILRSSLLALGVWAALGTAFAQAPPAEAPPTEVPRAVVLRFEGWRASRARRTVVRELASYVELVDEERAVEASRELGVDVSTPEGMAQVVEHLGISLVIAGNVEGRGRRATTTIYVTDAQGEELAQATGPSPRRRRDRQEIGQAAVEAVQQAQVVLEERRRAAMAPPPEPEPQPVVVEPEPEPEPEPVGWRQPMIVGLVGLRLRTAGTYVDDANEPLREHYFESDMYPEIDLYAVLRPWNESDDLLRGLLFGLQGSFSAGLEYVAANGEQRGMQSLRLRADVGYGYVLEEVLEVVGTLGLGIDGMLLSDSDGFPSALFTYLRPGVMGRYRAVPDFVIVEAGLGGRIGLDAGELGGAYGSLFFGGVDLFLGLTGTVEPGFTWAARVGYAYQGLAIDAAEGGTFGNGEGGSDETFDLRFLVGWQY